MSYKVKESKARWKGLLEIENKYIELTAAVESKFPGETRHQTALRYIKDRENGGFDNSHHEDITWERKAK